MSKESTLGALSPSPTQGEDTAVAAAAKEKGKYRRILIVKLNSVDIPIDFQAFQERDKESTRIAEIK